MSRLRLTETYDPNEPRDTEVIAHTPMPPMPLGFNNTTPTKLPFKPDDTRANKYGFKKNANKTLFRNQRNCVKYWLKNNDKCTPFTQKYNFPGRKNKLFGQKIYTADKPFTNPSGYKMNTRSTFFSGGSRRRLSRKHKHTRRQA